MGGLARVDGERAEIAGGRVQTDDAKAGAFRIPSLDGVRTLSFSIVFIAHAGASDRIPGGFGVCVFFFLSGFLIISLLRREHEATGSVSLKNFYLRRVARIFPPMYIVLALSVLLSLSGLLLHRVSLRPVLLQALYLTNYRTIFANDGLYFADGTEVMWSLAIEEHFYLLFPLFFLLLAKLSQRGRVRALLSLSLLVLVWRCVLVFHFHVPSDRTYLATDTRIDSILWGGILAVWANPVLDPPLRVGRGVERVLCVLGVGLLLTTFIWRNPQFRESFRYTVQGLALLPLFHFAVRRAAEPPFKWLNGRWIALVGSRYSYTLYLIHFIAINLIAYQCPSVNIWIRGAMALGLAFAVAMLMYYFVERPCLEFRRKLQRQIIREPRPA